MDPSASLCLMYDTFIESPPIIPNIDNWYSEPNNTILTSQITIVADLPAVYSDVDRYHILQQVKNSFSADGFVQARDITNPFENIPRSIFINRAAIKLANIDAVHHITNEIFTFNHKQSDELFTFCDVAAGPGSFTQYLQYRFPYSKGYGMTLRHKTLDWNTKSLDMSRFTPYYGPDNTGNLYTNWESFIKFVLSQQPKGVDLITADGGFDIEDSNDQTLFSKQEFLSSRLFITQALIGIGCAKIGGNFVLKSFDTVTTISAQILYVLSQCFDQIMIFKPISSRPANAEKYIICKNRKANIQPYYQLLEQAANQYSDKQYLGTIFSEPLPPQFIQLLTENNNQSITRQLQAAQLIFMYLKGQPINIPNYDIDKFLIIWNLPDTPPNRNSKIRVF